MRWFFPVLAVPIILAPLASPALELGNSGIALNPPDRGWKVEQHADAALEVWHLRAEQWQPPTPQSGLIALTVSMLPGDPWPDPGALRDAAARVLRGQMLHDVTADTPFELVAGRFQIAGEDFSGALGLGDAPVLPVSARLLVIRTGDGALLVTAFSALPADQEPFAALFGEEGLLTARGPGSEALNGPSAEAPPEAAAEPAIDPGIQQLLEQMQGSFGTQEGQ